MAEDSAPQPANTDIARFGESRLSPGPYRLDLLRLVACRVVLNGEETLFIEALRKLLAEKGHSSEPFGVIEREFITASGKKVVVTVPEPERQSMLDYGYGLLSVLDGLLSLAHDGVDVDCATWFYYDFDSSRDGDVAHSFFVMSGGKVVSERVRVASFYPLYLELQTDDQPIWMSHRQFDKAYEIYCYRKFYTETMQGQLMVLRPDSPILYHYDRPEADQPRTIGFEIIRKTYYLLWATVLLLAAVVLPSFRPYFVIAAAGVCAFVLRYAWETRKVGKSV